MSNLPVLAPSSAVTRFAGMDLPAEALRAQVTPNSTFGWTIVRGTTPGDVQTTGDEVRLRGWERHAIVQACIRVIAEMIAAIPLEATDRPPGEADAEVITKHPVLDVVRGTGVKRADSEFRLKGRIATQFLTYGNAFGLLERTGMRRRSIQRIRIIPPAQVAYAWLDDHDVIALWDWRDLQGRNHPRTPAADMLHFKDLDATDGLFGYPRGAAALRSIMADSEASEYVREVVTNHGTPGLVVLTEGPAPQKPEREAAEAAFNEKWVRRGQRGGTAFMSGIKSLVPLGFNLQELEFPDLRGVSREDICTAFNVDRRIIGVSSGTSDGGLSGEQFREARHRLIQMAAYPVMRAIEDELNHVLTPEFGDVYLRFSEEYIAAITEDVTQTSTRVVAEVAAKVRTVEEARGSIGLPAEMDPNHTYPGGLTVKAMQENAQALQSALLLAAQAPNDPPGEGDEPGEPTPDEQRMALLTRQADAAALDAAWRAQDERARREEAGYEAEALRRFRAERDDILATFAVLSAQGVPVDDRTVAAALQRIEADYAPGGDYHRAWLERYRALIARTVQVGGRAATASVGLSFNLENPHAQAAIARRTGNLVQHVTETTRDAIRAAVALGRQQGMGVAEIAKLIETTTFGDITKARALTIARTETVGALNAGAFEAAQQGGIMRSKTWLTNADGRVRDSHAALHGQRIPIDAVFGNGLPFPHADGAPASEVVNCRCTLLFHDEEAP